MDVLPAISTAERSIELEKLRRMPYAEFLKTPGWRKTRNRKLQAVNWRCERCGTNQNLQVHHKTYERLGEEPDEDLEALCKPCHEGFHFDQGQQDHAQIAIYRKMASQVLDGGVTFQFMADFEDAVAAECRRSKIAPHRRLIRKAAALLAGRAMTPQGTQGTQRNMRPLDDAITEREAREICRNLGLIVPLRSMPSLTELERTVIRETPGQYADRRKEDE